MLDPVSISLITVCLSLQIVQCISDVVLHIKSFNSGCLGKPIFSVKASFRENNNENNKNNKTTDIINDITNKITTG